MASGPQAKTPEREAPPPQASLRGVSDGRRPAGQDPAEREAPPPQASLRGVSDGRPYISRTPRITKAETRRKTPVSPHQMAATSMGMPTSAVNVRRARLLTEREGSPPPVSLRAVSDDKVTCRERRCQNGVGGGRRSPGPVPAPGRPDRARGWGCGRTRCRPTARAGSY